MATLSVTVLDPYSITWKISGLSSNFNESNYILAGIALESVSSGSYDAPDNICDVKFAPATGTSRTVTVNLYDYFDANTSYTVYGFVQTPAQDRFYPAGSASFRTPDTIPPSVPAGRTMDNTEDYVTAHWSSGLNASWYDVFYNQTGSAPDSYTDPMEVTYQRSWDIWDYDNSSAIFAWVRSQNDYGQSAWGSCGHTHMTPYKPTYSSASAVARSITVKLGTTGCRATHYALYATTDEFEPDFYQDYDAISTSGTITYEAPEYNTRYYLWARSVATCSRSSCVEGLSFWVYCGYKDTESPPYTSLSDATSVGCDWEIGRLSYYFNSSNYLEVGVCTNDFSDGASSISGRVGYKTPTSSGTSRIVTGTASGLTPNTTYTLYGYAKSMNGLYYPCGSDDIRTLQGVPDTPDPPVLSSRGEGTLSLYWNACDYATGYRLYYKKTTASSYDYVTSTTTSKTLSGLAYGTTYDLYLVATNAYGMSSDSYDTQATTKPKTPTITVSEKAGDWIKIFVASLPDMCDYVDVEVYRVSTGALVDTITLDTGTTFTGKYGTATGLLAGIAYRFEASSAVSASGTTIWSGTDSIETTTISKPSSWAWSYSISSGGSVYRSTYDSAHNLVIANIMPATEWNSFTSRINAFRKYELGDSQTYSFTSVSSGDSCTPEIINEAVEAINDMGYSISFVSAGNIPASVFISMRNTLNGIS